MAANHFVDGESHTNNGILAGSRPFSKKNGRTKKKTTLRRTPSYYYICWGRHLWGREDGKRPGALEPALVKLFQCVGKPPEGELYSRKGKEGLEGKQ